MVYFILLCFLLGIRILQSIEQNYNIKRKIYLRVVYFVICLNISGLLLVFRGRLLFKQLYLYMTYYLIGYDMIEQIRQRIKKN